MILGDSGRKGEIVIRYRLKYTEGVESTHICLAVCL